MKKSLQDIKIWYSFEKGGDAQMELIKQSVSLSWKNFILIVPFLMEAAAGLIVAMIGVILFVTFGWFSIESIAEHVLRLGVFIGGFALLFSLCYYLLHSFVLSGVFGMIKQVLEEKEVKMSDFFNYGKRYVWKAFCIQLVVYILIFLLTVPVIVYFVTALNSTNVSNAMPIGLFFACILYMFISMVLMLVSQFSILSVIRDERSIGQAIKLSFRIMTKGVLDCLILFGMYLLLLLPLGIVFIVLNLIPVVGSFAFMAVQYFLMVVLLIWSVLFYDKYKEKNVV